MLLLGGALAVPALAQEAGPAYAQGAWRAGFRERRLDRSKAERAPSTMTDNDAKIEAPGDYSFAIEHAGLTRLYRVHVPSMYSPARPTPMVLSFHGGGGSMDYQADDRHYGQISKSEQAGYIAVFPNGYSRLKSGQFATWNAGTCCAGARDVNSDDAGFVRDIIKRLSGQLNVDRERIFADGISNGGMMSYRLACEMSDVFKAVASVAGTDNTRTCTPKAPISILHIHARNDDLELFDGGAGRKSWKVNSFVSVPDSIAKWVQLDGCQPTPRRVFENSDAYCDAYTQCRGGVEVRLCVTETGGHSWPGGTKPRGGAPTSTALSATDVIWDFFNSR